MKRPADLAPTLEQLLTNPGQLQVLRANALEWARPQAASDAAEAILQYSHRWPHLSVATSYFPVQK